MRNAIVYFISVVFAVYIALCSMYLVQHMFHTSWYSVVIAVLIWFLTFFLTAGIIFGWSISARHREYLQQMEIRKTIPGDEHGG